MKKINQTDITLYKSSGILIPKTYKNNEFYVRIRAELTRRSKQYNTSDFIVQTFYLESDEGHLLIPRFFPVHEYINCKIEDKSCVGEDIDISHNITPKNELQKEAIDHMLKNNSGTIELQPGVGKTVISIAVMAKRKKKSFILVHRDSLVEQWQERFEQFTNLVKDKDIVRLTSGSFKDDLNNPIIVSTSQTFISLLKRKRGPFLKALKEANIGVFIADEVHTTVGAPAFSECSIHIPAKVIFGLSATPYRYDGNTDIINFHLGKTFSRDDDDGTMKAKVHVFLYDYQIDTPRRHTYIWWGGDFQRARYLNMIKKSEPFMKINKGLIEKIKNNKKVIYVAERIKLIEELFDWLKHSSKSKFIQSAKMIELEKDFSFATPGKIRDGVDAPAKDCLVMTSPASNIAQLSGRVVREFEGKQIPLIIDQVDIGCRRIASTSYKRFDYYRDKGWEIKFILVTPEFKAIEVDEVEAMKIIKGE